MIPPSPQLDESRTSGVGLSQSDLESRLWAAANSLRGPVDAADFKAYIFPLLFFKRICDAWDEEHAQALVDYGEQLDDEIEADYHRFVVPDGCHWAELRRLTENVGVGLQRMLQRIEQANPDTLAGVFGDVQWGNKEKLPEVALLNLIESFGSLDLSPGRVGNDILGAAYEYLLKQFADSSGAKAGEFFTPRAVVRLLTRILDPQPTDAVYDPACGSGGMLVEAANEVIETGTSLRQMRFYAQEVNLTTAAIARMNLYLHDIEDAKVLRGDTLRDPKFRDARGCLERFDESSHRQADHHEDRSSYAGSATIDLPSRQAALRSKLRTIPPLCSRAPSGTCALQTRGHERPEHQEAACCSVLCESLNAGSRAAESDQDDRAGRLIS